MHNVVSKEQAQDAIHKTINSVYQKAIDGVLGNKSAKELAKE